MHYVLVCLCQKKGGKLHISLYYKGYLQITLLKEKVPHLNPGNIPHLISLTTVEVRCHNSGHPYLWTVWPQIKIENYKRMPPQSRFKLPLNLKNNFLRLVIVIWWGMKRFLRPILNRAGVLHDECFLGEVSCKSPYSTGVLWATYPKNRSNFVMKLISTFQGITCKRH